MLLTSLGNYLSVHSVRKDGLKRTIILQLSDFISADCDYGSHGFLLSYEDPFLYEPVDLRKHPNVESLSGASGCMSSSCLPSGAGWRARRDTPPSLGCHRGGGSPGPSRRRCGTRLA